MNVKNAHKRKNVYNASYNAHEDLNSSYGSCEVEEEESIEALMAKARAFDL